MFNLQLFLTSLLGLALIVAAGCVLNNFLDRHADKKMSRTQNRPLPSGAITPKAALVYAAFLLIAGSLLLSSHLLALTVALLGFIIYVFFYSFLKYKTHFGTEIGSIAGAIPPVVGYTAASSTFDTGALLLFLIIALWQMPHFFAIALFRSREYASASIPVLPLVKGIPATKVRMVLYTVAFIASTLLLTFFGFTGYIYLTTAALLGLTWLVLCLKGLKAEHPERWAHKMFRFSLVIVTVLCAVIAIDVV